MSRKFHPFVWLVLFVFVGCGASSAAYTRARRATEGGAVPAPGEVRAEDFLAYVATEDAPRPPPGTSMRAPVWLDARAGSDVIPSMPTIVPLQVTLRGGVAAARYPSRLVVLVDVSGSMREGDKIGAVRHALARLIERLDPLDRIAIVTFSNEAHIALAPSEVGAERDVVLSAISRLMAQGGTNLHDGLTKALLTADAMRGDGAVTRVVLLSDGIASVGVTEPHAFDRLARWAASRSISITTVGMGREIDFLLLESLARAAGGEFHFLDRPSEVERLFSRELVSLVTLAARDVRVRVHIPPGWSLGQSFSERTEVFGGGTVLETRIGDLPSDGAFVVLHELIAPAGLGEDVLPVEVTLTAEDGSQTVITEAHVTIARHSGALSETIDASVLRNLALGRSAVALREAGEASRSGQHDMAWSTLDDALRSGRDAQATLRAYGDEARARSLDETLSMLERAHGALSPSSPSSITMPVRSSESFSGWR